MGPQSAYADGLRAELTSLFETALVEVPPAVLKRARIISLLQRSAA